MSGWRTVELAGEVGFCFGVKRAINLTEEALDRHGQVFINGDLVHNPTVMDGLKRRGLRKVASLDSATSGTVVVRAHGLPKREIEGIKAQGFNVVDATCPIVHRAQEAAQTLEQDGYQVLIIGDPHHAEVKGIVGSMTTVPIVVDSVEDLRRAKADRRLKRKVGVLFQTTHSLELCKDIVSELVFLCKDVRIINTICRPVQQRQDAAVEVAERVDLMLVVGSRTSANTMELAALCRQYNPYTKHVETAADLEDADLAWVTRVGLASGLSTPVRTVEEVAEAVLRYPHPPRPELRPPADYYALPVHGNG